jgi:uncharacterized protein (DUF1778 family)
MTKRQTHLGALAKDVRSTAAKGLRDPKSLTAKEVKSLAATALNQVQAATATARFTPAKPSPPGKALTAKTPAAKATARASSASFSAFATRESSRAPKAGPPAKAFSFRIDERTVGLIDQAAEAIGQTRTEFVLASARERATDVLLDQTLFRLSAADWEAFSAALDEPAAPNEELKQFLARKSPWEE